MGIEALNSKPEVRIKCVGAAPGSTFKYVTVSIMRTGKDVFVRGERVGIDEWEAFVETPLEKTNTVDYGRVRSIKIQSAVGT